MEDHHFGVFGGASLILGIIFIFIAYTVRDGTLLLLGVALAVLGFGCVLYFIEKWDKKKKKEKLELEKLEIISSDPYYKPSKHAVSEKITDIMVKKEQPISLGLAKTSGQQQQLNPMDQAVMDMINSDNNLRDMMLTNTNLGSNIIHVINQCTSSTGTFSSLFKRLKSNQRGKLLESLNKEQEEFIKQAAMLEEHVRSGARKQAEFKMYLAENALKLMNLQDEFNFQQTARKEGMIADDYSHANFQVKMSDIRMTEEDKKIERQKDLEGWRTEQSLSAAQRYRMVEDEVTDKLRKQLEQALIELDALEKRTDLSETAKKRLIDVKNRHIDNLDFRIKNREEMRLNDE